MINQHTTSRELGYKFYNLIQDTANSADSLSFSSSQLTSECIEKTGQGLDLSNMNLSGKQLNGVDLRKANLTRTILHDSSLDHSDLSYSTLLCTGLEKTSFVGANLQYFYGHALSAQVCDFSDANFSFSPDITGSAFHGCKMIGTKLVNAKLSGATFYQCNLDNSVFENAICNNINIVESMADMVSFSYVNIENARIVDSNMNHANFEGVYARGLNIRNSQLDNSVFKDSNLYRFYCSGDPVSEASFKNADFSGAVLGNSVFVADLSNANFQNIIAPYAIFNQSILTGANFDGANISHGIFIKANLKGVTFSELQKNLIFMDRCAK
jgi:uncharacterized protein YjbI with pentapeptide repeats